MRQCMICHRMISEEYPLLFADGGPACLSCCTNSKELYIKIAPGKRQTSGTVAKCLVDYGENDKIVGLEIIL